MQGTSNAASDLVGLLRDSQVLTNPKDLFSYSYDSSFESQRHERRPDVVVVPRIAEDVAATMKYAYEHDIPVTPRGAATGQTCGCVAAHGGIVIDLTALNRVIELDAANLQVIVEPGVVHAELNAFLAKNKLFFPPDPGSSKMCTVGGMVSNNARGMRAIKYGATGEYVLGLDVVLPNGDMITTGSIGSRALQSSSGLDLTKLFVGSEGVLGIITRLRLKVIPTPQARGIVMALFDDLEKTGKAAISVLQAGIIPAAIEIMDAPAIRAVNTYKPSLNLPDAKAILLFELDGNPAGVEVDGKRVSEIIKEYAFQVDWSNEPKRMATLWEARAVVGAASGRARPNSTRIYAGEDICVPLARVADALQAIQDIGAKYDTTIVTYGHIGNGNMHSAPVIDLTSDAEIARTDGVVDEIHQLALKLHGTVTGEHGVGITRVKYMREEHGPALDVMWSIKKLFDPKGIMNPGKIFPAEEKAQK